MAVPLVLVDYSRQVVQICYYIKRYSTTIKLDSLIKLYSYNIILAGPMKSSNRTFAKKKFGILLKLMKNIKFSNIPPLVEKVIYSINCLQQNLH